MTPRRRRMLFVGLILLAVSASSPRQGKADASIQTRAKLRLCLNVIAITRQVQMGLP